MDDAIPVPLEIVARAARLAIGRRVEPATAARGIGGVGGEAAHALPMARDDAEVEPGRLLRAELFHVLPGRARIGEHGKLVLARAIDE